MRALIDTCVLAEVRRPGARAGVKDILAQFSDEDLYLSVLTVGEIAKGVSLLAAGKKKRSLSVWLTGLETRFSDRILSVDVDTARLWGEVTARAQRAGVTIPAVDGLIAATALRHGLHVLTRNARHFDASGAMIIDPWAEGGAAGR